MGWTNEDQLTLLARQMVFHNGKEISCTHGRSFEFHFDAHDKYNDDCLLAVGPVPSPVVALPQQQPQLQASNWGHGFATSGAAAAAAHNNAYAQGRFGNSRGTTPPNGWVRAYYFIQLSFHPSSSEKSVMGGVLPLEGCYREN